MKTSFSLFSDTDPLSQNVSLTPFYFVIYKFTLSLRIYFFGWGAYPAVLIAYSLLGTHTGGFPSGA